MKAGCFAIMAWFMCFVLHSGHIKSEQFAATSIKRSLKMEKGGFVRGVIFSPRGNTLVVACGPDGVPGEIRLYAATDGKLLHTLRGHQDRVNCLAYVKEDILLSGGGDKQCLIWNTTREAVIGRLGGFNNEVVDIAVSPDNGFAYIASGDHEIALWNIETKKKITSIESQHAFITRLALNSTGDLLVGGGFGGTNKNSELIQIWETRTRKEIAQLKGHTSAITALTFTSDGRHILSCGEDGRVIMWDTKTWAKTGELDHAASDSPISLSMSKTGKCVAIGSASGFVDFYNISQSARIWELKKDLVQTRLTYWAHGLPVTALAYRPDGKMLASGSTDEMVKLWVNLPEFK